MIHTYLYLTIDIVQNVTKNLSLIISFCFKEFNKLTARDLREALIDNEHKYSDVLWEWAELAEWNVW